MPTAHNAETGGYAGNNEQETMFKYSLHFNERSIRQAFIRKVFVMVTIMLAIVALITAFPFIFHDTMGKWVKQNTGIHWAFYGIFLVTYIALICCEGVRRSFPANIIVTLVFTIATGGMTMTLSQQFAAESVLLCLIITTVCCAVIIVFSMQTKYDLTNCMGVLTMIFFFVFIFGIFAMIAAIFFKVTVLHTIYAGLMALVFMGYLAIDVQLLMGGRKYEISPEDHIFAAIQIFLDIVYIFWFLLSLFGSRN